MFIVATVYTLAFQIFLQIIFPTASLNFLVSFSSFFFCHLFLYFIQVIGPATIISFQRLNVYLSMYILILFFVLLMKYLFPRNGIDGILVGDGNLIYSWKLNRVVVDEKFCSGQGQWSG